MIADSDNRRRPKRFEAEAAYADSIFRSAMGDTEGCIRALEWAVEINPGYALRGVSAQAQSQGRRLLLSLVSMLDDAPDRTQIIDAAGDFLIQFREYADGLELYRAAVRRFPDVAVFHQGRGCCAGHMGELQEAVAASRHALELEPDNQQFVNDLGWSLIETGLLQEALATLERAVVMDPADELARENLRFCNQRITKRRRKKPTESRFSVPVCILGVQSEEDGMAIRVVCVSKARTPALRGMIGAVSSARGLVCPNRWASALDADGRTEEYHLHGAQEELPHRSEAKKNETTGPAELQGLTFWCRRGRKSSQRWTR